MIGNHKIIALCTARIHDKEVHSFINQLNKRIAEENGSLFVYNVRNDFYWDESKLNAETTVFDLINYDITDLVVIMDEKIKSKSITKRIADRAHAANVPVIVVDGKEEGCASVRFDFKKGFEKVVRHIVEYHNYKKVHFLGGYSYDVFSEERKQVFKQVLEENGIPFDGSMVSYGDFNAKPAQEATEKLIRKGNIPEAIICANDLMAFNVCWVLEKHGISVPEQVAVTGFDGIEEIHFFKPRMTSGVCSFDKVADVTFEAIDNCFNNREFIKEYLVEPELIEMESCGCSYHKKTETSRYLNIINDRFIRFQDENEKLSDISERFQSCETLEEAAKQLRNSVIYSACCVVNKSYIDSAVNPFQQTPTELFEDTMCVFCDTEDSSFSPYEISKNEIIPDLIGVIEKKYPLIFNVLDFMQIPMGYVCFHFEDDDNVHYSRIAQTVTALNNALGGYINMQYQRYLAQQVEKMYKFDSLSRLYNRQGFVNEYDNLQRKIKKEKGTITVVMADLDGLKKINDVHGHAAGDHAIRSLADSLVYACPDHALCVRFGGDEMVAVIEGDFGEKEIRERFNQYIDKLNKESQEPYVVSASLGIYNTSWDDDLDFESLIKNADKCMYADKNKKKK